MNRIRAWLLSVVVGLAVGGGTFVWLVGNALFASVLALVYAVGTWFFVEYAHTLPGEIRGDNWRTTRWSTAFVVFVMSAAIFGVGTTLPISNELRLALQLLVLGVGWTGLLFGVAMTRAQAAADESSGETGTASETDRDLA